MLQVKIILVYCKEEWATRARSCRLRSPRSHRGPLLGSPGMSESEKCVDGPTLRPSLAEFADPFAYFRSVRPLVEQFGIARIIPPPGWKPPFALDSDSLRLRTTTQRISDLQATDDVSQACFLQGLREFLNAIGQPLTKMPLLGGKDIDLFRLYHAVTDMGGYHQVVTLPAVCPVPPPPPPCRGLPSTE